MKRLALFHTFGAVLSACTCAGFQTTCEKLATAEVAFVGTIAAGTKTEFGLREAVVQIESVIRGLPADTREIRVNPPIDSNCYLPLALGERWLIVGGMEDNIVYAGTCSGSRPVGDLASIVDSYRTGPNLFLGSVRKYVGSDSASRKDNLVEGAVISLKGEGREWSAISGAAGTFELRGLPPGEYQFRVTKAGFSPELPAKWLHDEGRPPGKIVIPESGCVEAPILLWPETRIAGVVTSGDGNPVTGVKVTALRIEEGNQYRPERSAITGEKGEYTIARLMPGRYVFGVNVQSSDYAEYPATYHPSLPARVGGAEVTVADGKSLENIDIRTPLKRLRVTMRVRVLWPDDRPAARASVVVNHSETGINDRWSRRIFWPLFTDAEGHASIEVFEGTAYTLSAQWQRDEHVQEWHSTSRAPIVGTHGGAIVLRLSDKATQ